MTHWIVLIVTLGKRKKTGPRNVTLISIWKVIWKEYLTLIYHRFLKRNESSDESENALGFFLTWVTKYITQNPLLKTQH